MTVSSADYTTVVAECRDALARGVPLSAATIRLVIDVVQHAANTLDNNAAVDTVNTDADALEALLVTLFSDWNAVGAGDSSATYTAQLAALAAPRAALIASANAAVAAGGTTVTNITASDILDGRSA